MTFPRPNTLTAAKQENLAISELYLVTAMLFRKYDVYKGQCIVISNGAEEHEGGRRYSYIGRRAGLEIARNHAVY